MGRAVAEIRTRAGIRQQDLADAARRFGLSWNRSRIATLERGEKAVSIEELVMLAYVLSEACGWDVRVTNLLDSDQRVLLSPVWTAPARSVGQLLAGHGDAPGVRGTRLTVTSLPPGLVERMGQLGLAGGLNVVACLSQVGETEESAGRRLGEHAAVVVALSRVLWGRRLSDERDQIVAEQAPGADGERLRALRGQVTRTLVGQMAEEIGRRNAHGDLYTGYTSLAVEWHDKRSYLDNVLATASRRDLDKYRVEPNPAAADQLDVWRGHRGLADIEREITDIRAELAELGVPLPPLPERFGESEGQWQADVDAVSFFKDAELLAQLSAASEPLGDADTRGAHDIGQTTEDTE